MCRSERHALMPQSVQQSVTAKDLRPPNPPHRYPHFLTHWHTPRIGQVPAHSSGYDRDCRRPLEARPRRPVMRRPIVSKTIVAALAVGLATPAVGAFPDAGRAATPLPASAVAADALAMEWSGTVSWANSEAFELAGSNTHETWTSQSSGSWQLEGSVVLDDSLPHDLRGSGATSVHAEYLFHMAGPCPG